MAKSIKKIFAKIHETDTLAEEITKKWLEKRDLKLKIGIRIKDLINLMIYLL